MSLEISTDIFFSHTAKRSLEISTDIFSVTAKMLLEIYQMVLLAQMKRLFSKTQQRFSVFGTCFDVSNIIISHYEYM